MFYFYMKKIEKIAQQNDAIIEYDDYRDQLVVSFNNSKNASAMSDFVIEYLQKMKKYFFDVDCNINDFEEIQFIFKFTEKAIKKIEKQQAKQEKIRKKLLKKIEDI